MTMTSNKPVERDASVGLPGGTFRLRESLLCRAVVLSSLWLSLSCLLVFFAPSIRASDPLVEVFNERSPLPSEQSTAIQSPSLPPLLISFGVHGGYDDNSRTSSDSSGSFFSDQQLALTYGRQRGPLDLRLFSGVGVVERFGQQTDINAFVDLSTTYQASRRLTLAASINAAYRSEPDFSSDVGPDTRAGNYFKMTDSISAAYQWRRRFSTVDSYVFRIVRYEDSSTAFFTDREEHTFGQEFRFVLNRSTVLVADYRFLAVDYVSYPLDSLTSFGLVGVEHSFNPKLQGQLRAGGSFRSYEEGEDRVDPNFEGSLNYAFGRDGSLTWTTRYSVEEPAVREALTRTTFRTGVQLRYPITARISSAVGANYHHDENEAGLPVAAIVGVPQTSFTSNAFDLILSLRYQINRHADIDLGYERSQVYSTNGLEDYSRNRYSLGVNVTF